MGRRDASDSDDVSDPEASPRGAGAEQDGHDPFFQQDDDVFDDPWFAAVRSCARRTSNHTAWRALIVLTRQALLALFYMWTERV
jgi:hypothetical protein